MTKSSSICCVCFRPEAHYQDEVYLTYLEEMCTIHSEMRLPENGKYKIEVIDVWEMTRKEVLTDVCGMVSVKLPGKPGMAILATKQ